MEQDTGQDSLHRSKGQSCSSELISENSQSRRLPGKFLVAKALFLHSGCSFKFLLRLQWVTHTCGVKVEPGARHHGINTRCELALDKHQVSNWIFLVIGIPVLPSCTWSLCWSSKITSFIPAQESSLQYIVVVVQLPTQVQLFVFHGLQHARLPCPSPCPVVCPSSCPLNQWCHPTISSSVTPFSFCLQSFPASGSLPVSQLFISGGQSIGTSVSYFSGRFLLGENFLPSLPGKNKTELGAK